MLVAKAIMYPVWHKCNHAYKKKITCTTGFFANFGNQGHIYFKNQNMLLSHCFKLTGILTS